MLLRGLFSHWRVAESHHDSIGEVATRGYPQVPPHTPLIICEASGRPLLRLLVSTYFSPFYLSYMLINIPFQVKDASMEAQSSLLSEVIPQWITNVVQMNDLPKFNKMPFFLAPHPSLHVKAPKK